MADCRHRRMLKVHINRTCSSSNGRLRPFPEASESLWMTRETAVTWVCSHPVHTVLLNTKFPSKPFGSVLLGRVLLNFSHVVVAQCRLHVGKIRVSTRRRLSRYEIQCEILSNLVHSVFLHPELPSISVGCFGHVVLLLHLFVLLGHLVPELCNADRMKGRQCHWLKCRWPDGERNMMISF